MKKPTIVFLLESISQPRCIKRINSFIDNGFDVEIYGIDRGKYIENANISEKKINVISKHAEGKDYLKRAFNNLKSVRKIINKYKQDNTIFYCFGFMMTFTLRFYNCKNYIYEIADIMYGYKKLYPVLPIFKIIDKMLIKKSLLTVMTSEGFANFFYKNRWPKNIIIQHNKLDKFFHKEERPTNKADINNIVFSYVGSFRYPNTVFRFAEIIGKYYPQHEFHFYGDSILTSEVIKLSEKYNNVYYYGSFKNPDDLSNVYKKINIVVACYETENINERIAEPNKLYEALFFNKPIIVSEKTFLSEKVQSFNCGYIIDASNDYSIKQFIDKLDNTKNDIIINNILSIKKEDLIDNDSINIISYLKTINQL